MDRRIRAFALFLVACFALLILQLNNLQVKQATTLNAENPVTTIHPFEQPRGEIVAANGDVLARSTATHDTYRELRSYPGGSLFADVTGRYDVVDANSTGLEYEYDAYLKEHESSASTLRGLLSQQEGTDTVVTTIDPALQRVAAQALAPYSSGAVVAVVPQTGAILALYSKPSYDPNLLTSHDAAAVHKAYAQLNGAAGQPLADGATYLLYHPGSTFKVITTAAVLDHDPKLAAINWPYKSEIPLPESNLFLSNFDHEVCGGSLALILAKSCDTAYADLGLKLGAPNLGLEANAFGLNSAPPIDLPSDEVSAGCFPPTTAGPSPNPDCPTGDISIGEQNQPLIAYSAIGQEDVTESALEDAMVAGAIADGGTMMTPHLMNRIVNDAGSVVDTFKVAPWRQATGAATADQVRSLMLGVSTQGTAAGLFKASDDVASKTGTAETGTSDCSTNWLIATAPAGPTDTPAIAVAAVVPYQANTACDGTGAEIAGPVVAKVINAYLGGTP
jgi:peptidoglycan glycosyltransferase